jgi:pimeloyl-ACP methyl ester carboxylesterase
MNVEHGRSDVPHAPTLVCVHGLSGSSRWWSGVTPRFEEAGPVVLLDLPRSVAPFRLPEWVIEQLEGLEPPVDVAGHSLGGLLAARVASLRPDLVRRLVLIAPPGIRPRSSMLPYVWPLAMTVARSRPALLRRLTADALRAGPRNLLRGGRHVATADVRADLESVVAPTLLVWGARDTIVPPVEGSDWCESLADARLVVLPRAGHVPMIDAADELADVIVAFREKPLDELGDLPGM